MNERTRAPCWSKNQTGYTCAWRFSIIDRGSFTPFPVVWCSQAFLVQHSDVSHSINKASYIDFNRAEIFKDRFQTFLPVLGPRAGCLLGSWNSCDQAQHHTVRIGLRFRCPNWNHCIQDQSDNHLEQRLLTFFCSWPTKKNFPVIMQKT